MVGEVQTTYEADPMVLRYKNLAEQQYKRDIELPRPRELEVTYTKEFADVVHELRGHIGAIRKTTVGVAP